MKDPMIHPKHLLPNVDPLYNFYKKNESIENRLDKIHDALEYLKQREEEECIEEDPTIKIKLKPMSFKTATIIVIVAHLLVGGYFVLKPAKQKPQKIEYKK